MRKRSALLLGAALWSLAGCGGGASSPGSPATAALTLDWGPRSRAALSSALSATIEIAGAGEAGATLRRTINRRSDPAAYAEVVLLESAAARGTFPVQVRFFAQSDGNGDLVGEATTTDLALAPGERAERTITAVGAIQSVAVGSGQSVLTGAQNDLNVTARSGAGALVAVTPGSFSVGVVSGADRLGAEGTRLLGKRPGTAQVVARIDGIASAPTDIAVTSNARVVVPTPFLTIDAGDAQTLRATVEDAPETAVTWSVEEGAAGGTIDATGKYTAPTLAGTYHVVARSAYDPSKSAPIVVTVPVNLTLTPEEARLGVGDTLTFQARLRGVATPQVVWSVEEGAVGGTIDASGRYTAPGAPGVFHVRVRSASDTSLFRRATVTVESGSGTLILQ